MGAALFPEHGRQSSELLRHADIALYAAKDGGRSKLLVYESWMQDEVRERAAMISRARQAVENDEIVAFYQPKVCLRTGALAGFEALLRWRNRVGKIHLPASIAAGFEETDVADQLGQAMLRNIVTDIVRWREKGLDFGHVALNAAPAEFKRTNFASRLIDSIRVAGLSPQDIEVEITEGVFLGRGTGYAEAAIQQLVEHGTPIVLDDFGTGFASLSHLRALAVDKLKIDRSFIQGVTEEDGDATIVKAIVDLGHNLGIRVVAEGIETLPQAELLSRFGCDFAQGHYFCRPVPSDVVPDLIRNWTDFSGRDRSLVAATNIS
jgi:EAL domain-containing protein (putative c-di-GMP-specific phosphodiesterase class I)